MTEETNKYEKIVKNFCKRANSGKHRLSPLKAIRAKCLDCTMYQACEVARCDITDCPLHAFRGGRNMSAPRTQKGIVRNSDAIPKRQNKLISERGI